MLNIMKKLFGVRRQAVESADLLNTARKEIQALRDVESDPVCAEALARMHRHLEAAESSVNCAVGELHREIVQLQKRLLEK